jgi:hypothetical protein
MSYIINKTDGSVLTEITDGNIDQVATDLTLIGKSASAYGEYINENLVRLLENFANTSQPLHPVEGQLWYDTIEKRVKVYDSTAGFKLTSGTIVSDIVPSSIAQGDIWIDSKRQQLYFNDGVATILAGPYDPAVTGFSIIEVLDIYDIPKTLMVLVIDTVLFAIYSNEEFTPGSDILASGFSDQIKVGLNLINSSIITNVADPVSLQDAVNKRTLINSIKLAPLVVSVDISAFTGDKNAKIITDYLNVLFPPSEYNVAGGTTRCKVICNDTTAPIESQITIRQFYLTSGTWQIPS